MTSSILWPRPPAFCRGDHLGYEGCPDDLRGRQPCQFFTGRIEQGHIAPPVQPDNERIRGVHDRPVSLLAVADLFEQRPERILYRYLDDRSIDDDELGELEQVAKHVECPVDVQIVGER